MEAAVYFFSGYHGQFQWVYVLSPFKCFIPFILFFLKIVVLTEKKIIMKQLNLTHQVVDDKNGYMLLFFLRNFAIFHDIFFPSWW